LEAKKYANQNQAKPATENPNGVHQGHRLHQMRVQKVCADPLRWERHLRPLWTLPNPVGCILMIYDPESIEALATLPAWVIEGLLNMTTNAPHWEHDPMKRLDLLRRTFLTARTAKATKEADQ
jgi:hypothetical protein